MAFYKSVKICLTFFYFCGLFLHKLTSSGHAQSNQQYVFAAIRTIIAIALPIRCLILLNFYDIVLNFFGIMEAVVIHLSVVCDAFRAILILIECIQYDRLINNILNTFSDLQVYFFRNFRYRINYQNVTKCFFVKIAIIFAINMSYILWNIMYWCLSAKLPPMSIEKRVMQCVSVLPILYIIFFIDMLSYHLNELNAVIKKDIAAYKCSTNIFLHKFTIINKLKHYKVVHYRLWMISQWINTIFGWSIVFLLLLSVSDCIYSTYWFYQELRRRSPIIRVARKYN